LSGRNLDKRVIGPRRTREISLSNWSAYSVFCVLLPFPDFGNNINNWIYKDGGQNKSMKRWSDPVGALT
jgi:hypothetical protein